MVGVLLKTWNEAPAEFGVEQGDDSGDWLDVVAVFGVKISEYCEEGEL